MALFSYQRWNDRRERAEIFSVCLEEDGEMEGKRRAGVGRENWWLLFLDSRERERKGGITCSERVLIFM